MVIKYILIGIAAFITIGIVEIIAIMIRHYRIECVHCVEYEPRTSEYGYCKYYKKICHKNSTCIPKEDGLEMNDNETEDKK
jgi:hypothetical protein